MTQSPRAPLEQLIARWREKAEQEREASRAANHAGNQEMDAYRDGKSMAFRECAEDLEALALVLGPQPEEPETAHLPDRAAIWSCKIGQVDRALLPDGSDGPLRRAVQRAYFELTGQAPMFTFSGWGAVLDEAELAVVEQREGRPMFTLQSLAVYLGWGERMSDEDVWKFLAERERLLRGAMDLLETHKSDAPTAELAIKDRITALGHAGSVPSQDPK